MRVYDFFYQPLLSAILRERCASPFGKVPCRLRSPEKPGIFRLRPRRPPLKMTQNRVEPEKLTNSEPAEASGGGESPHAVSARLRGRFPLRGGAWRVGHRR